jgi:5'(3')-deoxyribonucleotidase
VDSLIFLDVDGVVANFVTPVMKVFGSPITNETLHSYDISDVLGMSYKDMWEHPVIASMDFWASLPKMPWADEVVAFLASRGELAFLTQPIRSPQCLAGKKAWMAQHFPDVPFFIANKKVLLARPGLTLIDDYHKNVNEWRDRGGKGVLFPAAYNQLGHMDDPMSHLKAEL